MQSDLGIGANGVTVTLSFPEIFFFAMVVILLAFAVAGTRGRRLLPDFTPLAKSLRLKASPWWFPPVAIVWLLLIAFFLTGSSGFRSASPGMAPTRVPMPSTCA